MSDDKFFAILIFSVLIVVLLIGGGIMATALCLPTEDMVEVAADAEIKQQLDRIEMKTDKILGTLYER